MRIDEDWEDWEDWEHGEQDVHNMPTSPGFTGAYTRSNGFFQTLMALACQHPTFLGRKLNPHAFHALSRLNCMWLCTISANTYTGSIPNVYW